MSRKRLIDSEPYLHGIKCWYDRQPVNPHQMGTWSFEAWNRGYYFAQCLENEL